MTNSKAFTNSLGQDFCTVNYTSAFGMIAVTWKGGATRESVRQVRDWILVLLKENRCPLLLNDMQELIVVSSEEFVKWLKEEWDVIAAGHGLQYIADVVRKDSIAENYLRELRDGRESAAKSLTIMTFNTRFGAMEWLLEKKGGLIR